VNFLIRNRRIVFSLLDPSTEPEAWQAFERIFPDYQVVGVAVGEVLLGGGNIHSITQQIPG